MLFGNGNGGGTVGERGESLLHVLQGQLRGIAFFGKVREHQVSQRIGAAIGDDGGDGIGGLAV